MADDEWMVDPSELEEESTPKVTRKHTGRNLFPVLATLIIILATAGGVIALTLLFTQTLPSTPAATLNVTTQCLTLQAIPSTILLGSSGTILYSCVSPSGPTFSASGGAATPTFIEPAGLSLSAVAFVSGATSCAPGAILTSGVSVSLPVGGYDYCGTFTSYPVSGFASFDVSWSQ